MPRSLIHSICVAEFDELKGNTLSYVYPEDVDQIESHTPEAIAELCLPDGGHKHPSDSIYILLTGKDQLPLYGYAFFRNRKDLNEKRGARQLALLVIATAPYYDRFRPFLTVAVEEYLDQHESKAVIHTLYAALEKSYRRTKRLAEMKHKSIDSIKRLGQEDDDDEENSRRANYARGHDSHSFLNNKDETGAITPGSDNSGKWSLDSSGESPREDVESPTEDNATTKQLNSIGSVYFGKLDKVRYQNTNESGLLSTSTYTMQLWGKMFVMQPLNVLSPNEFGGASLRDLVLRFRVQTMTLWASIVSLKRVLVCGPESKAESVGNIVLATPLLLGPLGALIVPNLVPYVTLADIEPVTKHGSFVCGTTNGLFATKEQWYDILVDPCSNKISAGPKSMIDRMLLKVQGNDLIFINRVLDGIENGRRDEDWVRFEFATYTQDFLDTVKELEVERVSKRARQQPLHRLQEVSSEVSSPVGFSSSPSHSSPCSPNDNLSSPSGISSPLSGGRAGSSLYNATRLFHNRSTSAGQTQATPQSNFADNNRQDKASKRNLQKWPSKITPFLKRKVAKSASDTIALTFAGSPLWLRYRWMQLNPESFNPTRRRLSRIHSIEIKHVEDTSVPPAPPKRPEGWKASSRTASNNNQSKHPIRQQNGEMPQANSHPLTVFTSSSSGRKFSSYAVQPMPRQQQMQPSQQHYQQPQHRAMDQQHEIVTQTVNNKNNKSQGGFLTEQSKLLSKHSLSSASTACSDTTISTHPSTSPPKAPLSKWKQAMSPAGEVYYWNTETLETSWTPPPTESTEVSTNHSSPQGSPSSSCSSRSARGQNQACPSPQATSPTSSVDSNSSKGSKHNDLNVDVANKWVMANGRWHRMSVVIQDDLALKTKKKTDWVEAFTERGEPYWWNVTTGETCWELPTA